MAALALALFWLEQPHAAGAQATSFDHLRSGFPLSGAHQRLECESCHVQGRFEGTPRQCVACHGGNESRAITTKTAEHIPSANTCEDCHSTRAWKPLRFDHGTTTASCVTCHDGTRAPGKPAGHVPSTSACEDCHSTRAWSPARFDHAGVTSNCATCHNGVQATGKTPDHLPSANTCDDCHTTAAWTPARFDHAGVTAACSTCHNGVQATGKTPDHLPTSNACDDCHTTAAWSPARFDHAGITTSCATCHNGTYATGTSAGHFASSLDCAECHRTTFWTPATYTHASAAYPTGHRDTGDCQSCHVGNTAASAWRTPAYRPDCAGCHAADFRPGPHKKVASPTILYTVSELRDCTGACHEFTDASFTRIRRTRSGEHSAARGGW